MQLEIQGLNISLTRAIHAYIMRRVHFAFSSRESHLQRVMVRLRDINGPKGGRDKHCQIQLIGPKVREIIIEDTAENLYVAIDRAADRASRTLTRKLTRRRSRQIRPGRTPILVA